MPPRTRIYPLSAFSEWLHDKEGYSPKSGALQCSALRNALPVLHGALGGDDFAERLAEVDEDLAGRALDAVSPTYGSFKTAAWDNWLKWLSTPEDQGGEGLYPVGSLRRLSFGLVRPHFRRCERGENSHLHPVLRGLWAAINTQMHARPSEIEAMRAATWRLLRPSCSGEHQPWIVAAALGNDMRKLGIINNPALGWSVQEYLIGLWAEAGGRYLFKDEETPVFVTTEGRLWTELDARIARVTGSVPFKMTAAEAEAADIASVQQVTGEGPWETTPAQRRAFEIEQARSLYVNSHIEPTCTCPVDGRDPDCIVFVIKGEHRQVRPAPRAPKRSTLNLYMGVPETPADIDAAAAPVSAAPVAAPPPLRIPADAGMAAEQAELAARRAEDERIDQERAAARAERRARGSAKVEVVIEKDADGEDVEVYREVVSAKPKAKLRSDHIEGLAPGQSLKGARLVDGALD